MHGIDILFLLIPISVVMILGFVFYMFYQMLTSGCGPFNFIHKMIVPKIRPMLPKICFYQKIGFGLIVFCAAVVFAQIFPVTSAPDIILFIGMAIGMFMLLITSYLRILVCFFS